MKRVGLFLIGLVFLLGMISFVSAETSDFCSNNLFPYEAECGTYPLQGSEINCGTCSDGLCIAGKCYGFDELGNV